MTIEEKKHQLEAYIDVIEYIRRRLSLLAQDVAEYSIKYENATTYEERNFIKFMLDDLVLTINGFKSIEAPIVYLATH